MKLAIFEPSLVFQISIRAINFNITHVGCVHSKLLASRKIIRPSVTVFPKLVEEITVINRPVKVVTILEETFED